MARPQERRSIAVNRKARHLYHLLDELECGIQLRGTEVKSLRAGHCSLQEAYGRLRRGELYLVGATIPVYSHGNVHNHEPARERKLLAHRRELAKWEQAVKEKGTTIVPLEIYFQKSLVKVTLALARGKKLFDKREDQKARDAKRDIDRELTRRR
ncbi:MAG: SsrA-binding protein SmpB [Planctomycetota bacterium]